MVRELLGSGQVLGHFGGLLKWYQPNLVMVLAPGAFIALGFVIALYNVLKKPELEEKR